ncbi:DNA-directed RNA polymerase subunit beta' [Candidatus Parcubacteria bacterium]|nr:DNA-directed RNA polymerase subunit beta' [Candidatus Parcubacteria bacterium]
MPERSQVEDFDAIRLRVASPERILEWSHGEVLKPETINYRTQKPERDGLFCEKIFGPVKDWECACGKYKKIRYKGIVCDKCGVEVTRSLVRRERMGHISLAAPVSHIWFLRGVPSKIGLMLDMSAPELEKVVYFADFIVTSVSEDLKKQILEQTRKEYKVKKKALSGEFEKQKVGLLNSFIQKPASNPDGAMADKSVPDEATPKAAANKNQSEAEHKQMLEKELDLLRLSFDKKYQELDEALLTVKKELDELKPLKILSEHHYQELSLKYGHVFEASIGAEAVHNLLMEINLEKLAKDLEKEIRVMKEKQMVSQEKRVMRRLKLAKDLIANDIRPEWMVLTQVPVIPPDLRPMVQLDGGRFASSDLNDLYRRVINRNNRLKKLIELSAPEVICRNEKRMLQEAVDALIDNSARHGKTVAASTGQRRMLKSIADILKGKQGRFRQNLLGKRVDYSGRSVIIVGPHLRLDQVGLPKTMAVELFKPFVISKLIERGHVHNVRSASRMIEQGPKEVWDILEEVTKDSTVFINRAPTLHRLSIQSFHPVLIEGKAIQIHPLICAAFNADFDGDQMAVHVPLTEGAKKESEELMISVKNLLKPATGEPVITPDKDMVWGSYFLTTVKEDNIGPIKCFSSEKEVALAHDLGKVDINEKIKIRINGQIIETGVGRVIFNSILPQELRVYDKILDKKSLRSMVSENLDLFGSTATAKLLDQIKELTLEYLTVSGLSWGMDDLPKIPGREDLITKAEQVVEEIQEQYEAGLLTDDERHIKVIETWARVKDKITDLSQKGLDKTGPIFSMIDSGARGSWGQITQMMGMKGLVTNPQGETIELPVKANFKKGFDVLEYFISTHGTRKGLSDTALRTANAGYLTRRLVDVSQDAVIIEEDCQDKQGIVLTREESEEMGEKLEDRIVGRILVGDITNPKSGKVIVKDGEAVTKKKAAEVVRLNLKEIRARSVISCKSQRGICQKCYGYDLGYNKMVKLGAAVGIVAAQSIGEPGTQLTLRTFHTGGIAGKDITQGLPRVEELFEARPLKKKALIAEVSGKVKIVTDDDGAKTIQVFHQGSKEDRYLLIKNAKVKIKDGKSIEKGEVIFEVPDCEPVVAKNAGLLKVTDKAVTVIYEKAGIKEYPAASNDSFLVADGDLVNIGDQLVEGNIDLHQLYEVQGRGAVQKYIVKEIQYIYSSQGQKLNDKHVEIIVRQMFSRCLVLDAGDTNFLAGEIVSRAFVEKVNSELSKGAKPAKIQELLLGITKVSLSMESFLAAASFQETARILIDASTTGRVDRLLGLKENVIIGRLIPAGTGFKGKQGKLPNFGFMRG